MIGRMLFLEGMPKVSTLNQIMIGSSVDKQLEHDHRAEESAIQAYNNAIILAGEVKDYATRNVLQQILNNEDTLMDGIKELQDQIQQMSLQIFFTTRVNE